MHLVDMDNVTTRAVVQTGEDELSATFTVTGEASLAKLVQHMVLAHSPMLQMSTGWAIAAKAQKVGATMMHELAAADEVEQATGLAFFGLMTISAHHQQCHFMIARGHPQH